MGETYIFHSRNLGRIGNLGEFLDLYDVHFFDITYFLYSYPFIFIESLENLLFFNKICALSEVQATKKYQNCSLIIQKHLYYTFEIFRP